MCRSASVARVIAAVAIAGVASLAHADTALRYGFGTPATAVEISGWDIDVRPDGAGLPEGRGSVAEGQAIYDAKCATCHGTFGESTDYMAIAGGVGSLASDAPMRTTGSKLNYATTLFDYIRRAMPFNAPKSLSTNEVYALTAYVLNLNDILPADAVLDRRALIAVRMPNRDGFTTQHGFMRADGRPDTHATACMMNCTNDVRLLSQIPEYARNSHGDVAEQTARGRTNVATANVEPTAAGGAGMELATRSGCLACHGIDKGIVGPAFTEIARRYRGDATAAAKLVRKVQEGGAGSFGAAAMPPQNAPVVDIRVIVDWILQRLQ